MSAKPTPRKPAVNSTPGPDSALSEPSTLLYVTPRDLGEHVDHQKPLHELIIQTDLTPAKDPKARAYAVAERYNKNVTDKIITTAGARSGERVDPGYYFLAHRNRVPELAVGTGERLALKLTGTYTAAGVLGTDGKFLQLAPLIGDYGVFVVNVPVACYAKVWSGNTPKLLGEGTHVIHDEVFRPNTPADFFVKVDARYVNHGTLHLIRVPQGHFCKVTVDTQPYLLKYRAEPYSFDTAYFEFEGDKAFIPQGEAYIRHGPIHVLRVPAGCVAKAWLGSRPLLLEYREEPYYFHDPDFKFETAASGNRKPFMDALEKHIRHGTMDRLRPGVNGDLERAVIQHDGEIQFIDRFTTLEGAHHAVLGFLNMGMQTYIFPGKSTREERKRENPSASTDEINYEPMTTRDSLKVGMKLLVAFQVQDSNRALSKLRIADIVPHVENLAVSDMVRAVQNSTSQNFLNANIRKSNLDIEEHEKTMADRVREELANHLDDCGLKLVRFNIEEAKVLDAGLAKEMAKQSLVAAQASAEQAVIEQKTAVAKSNAELEAMTRRVKQDQENAIKIAAARADLESARLRAEGQLVEAEAKKKAMEMEGSQYRMYPELLQLKLAELQFAALGRANLNIIAPEIAQSPFTLGFPPGLYPAARSAPPQ